jgi:aminopeptidase S
VKLTRFSLACLLLCVAVQAAPAQDPARIATSLEAITAARDNNARRDAIVRQLRTLGIEPAVEPFGQGRGAGANVVVTLPATGATTIVVGAHLDRVSVGRGAVDNGAACAALIELIAAFTSSPLTRATLQIVFFDREEAGLLGSRAFVAAGHGADYAINMDIFAYGDAIFATASHQDGVLLRALRAAGMDGGIPIRDVPRGSYPSSDHLTMMQAGIETLGIALIDTADIAGVLAIGGGRLTLGSGPRILTIIHSANDTLAEVRPEQMARGIALVEQLIRNVDREPSRSLGARLRPERQDVGQ